MWWWTKVRKADIPDDVRAIFQGYGENIIATVLATRQHKDYGDLNIYLAEAILWLRERHDVHARREDRLETVEWAILIFVVVGVLADVAIVAHEVGVWPR
jgi:hypothetical protein